MKIEATPKAPTEVDSENGHAACAEQALELSQHLLSLPLLHRDGVSQHWRTTVPHLWPGLPSMPEKGYVELSGYPFSPQEALACLRDLEAMSMAALSGVPLQALAAQEHRPQSARELEEQDSLRRFAATGEDTQVDNIPAQDDTLLRKAAHKVLLWAWLLEERQREVRELASSFDANANHLMDALGVEDDNDFSGLHALDMQFGQDAGLLPPWKLVVQNAALFLTQPCTIIVNDPRMAEAVAEIYTEHAESLENVDASAHVNMGLPTQPGFIWKKAELPLWKIIGLSAASPQCPWLERKARILFPLACTHAKGKEATA